MSPVSRGRKGNRGTRSTRRTAPPELLYGSDPCDCPACTGEDFDPRQVIDDLVTAANDVLGVEDPLDAEIWAAVFLAIGERSGAPFEEALVGGLIPQFEASGGAEVLAMLLALGSVAQARVAEAASAAAGRLVRAGVQQPRWAVALSEPLTVAGCRRLRDGQGTGSVLACSFQRAGRSHAVLINVDALDCGAASTIAFLDAEHLPEALKMLRADGRADGWEIIDEVLDPAEFRWQVEKALDARAVHDGELPDEDVEDTLLDEDGPGYPALAVLVRARMSVLPVPSKPAPPHPRAGDGRAVPAALQALAQFIGSDGRLFGTRGSAAAPATRKLPAKRKRSDGPAPIFQIKVGLRGAKPPIWRRLEVPADISLARLHEVIQVAFGWEDSHLHVFETPCGRFGTADAELGHRAEAPVTLEQVAPAAGSKVRYTYDFGDDWEHDIVVDKVFGRDQTIAYPRCTGGRRAAPPEDCGGIWGYAELVDVLSDPDHPDHSDRLEWLGLDTAADFAPDRFDAEAVTKALSTLR